MINIGKYTITSVTRNNPLQIMYKFFYFLFHSYFSSNTHLKKTERQKSSKTAKVLFYSILPSVTSTFIELPEDQFECVCPLFY